MTRPAGFCLTWLGLLAAPILAAVPGSGTAAESVAALKRLSIEELMNVEVTSVSRRPGTLLEAAASVEVITAEDIRRSGASSLPAALLLARNLDVAQESSHEWVISARGFSSDVGNKLLVMIDGRTVYTPLFSGVFWDRQDYLLEDIDRIEVISGPGGTLWGANAVNGVINIITRRAQDTQGLLLETMAGRNPRGRASVRYGSTLGESVHWRAYGNWSDWRSEQFTGGADAHDAWRKGQAGFRLDAQPSLRHGFTLQGDVYRNEEQLTSGGEATISGGNLLGRWTQVISDESELAMQVYYDRTSLNLPVPAMALAPAGLFQDDLDTLDFDLQHSFRWGARNHVVWGLGYRYTYDEVGNAPGLAFFPTRLAQNLFSAFVQDDLTLRDGVVLTLGTKVEHTAYTGFEYEPNIRMRWSIAAGHSLWGAVSRAVRTPSRIDRDLSQPAPGYLIVVLRGGQQFESEDLLAYELGYRGQLSSVLSASISAFYNDYTDLRSTSMSPPDPLFRLPFPFFFENHLEGETHGFELTADLRLSQRWALHGGYRLLQQDIRVEPGRFDFNNALNETSDPQQQFSLRASVDLAHGLELDAGLRWVDTRQINDAGVRVTVPDFMELNLRLGWRVSERLDLALVGQNLLHDRHAEYGQPGPERVQIGRSVFARVAWRSGP